MIKMQGTTATTPYVHYSGNNNRYEFYASKEALNTGCEPIYTIDNVVDNITDINISNDMMI